MFSFELAKDKVAPEGEMKTQYIDKIIKSCVIFVFLDDYR